MSRTLGSRLIGKRIVEALRAYTLGHGYPPSISEMALLVGISPSAIQYHLVRLKTLGLVSSKPGANRTWTVVDSAKDGEELEEGGRR